MESTAELNFTSNLPEETLLYFRKTQEQWKKDYHATVQRGGLFNLATTVIVFDDEDRILLVKRAPKDSMPNLWECPGGGVEDHDPTLFHAAARELGEEAGLKAVSVDGIVVEGEEWNKEGKKVKMGEVDKTDEIKKEDKKETRPPWTAFTNRNGTKLLARFTFEMGVETTEGVTLKMEEHRAYAWATEEDVKAGKAKVRYVVNGNVGEEKLEEIPMSTWQMRGLILDAFRLRRERKKREKRDGEGGMSAE